MASPRSNGALAKRAGLAKYLQISHEMIRQIRNGKISPGRKIPSENEIIAAYGVSNTTARRALQHIEQQGFARRVKGKGTYARQPEVVRSVDKILSFTKNMVESGYRPSTKLLRSNRVREGHSAFLNGRNYTIKGPVYRVQRLRFADDIPMLLETRYISAALCPDIDKQDLEGSLYEIYEKVFHLHLTQIQQLLRTVMLEEDTLQHFGLMDPIPSLLVEGATFCGPETILELEYSIYRGDKYEFAVTSSGAEHSSDR